MEVKECPEIPKYSWTSLPNHPNKEATKNWIILCKQEEKAATKKCNRGVKWCNRREEMEELEFVVIKKENIFWCENKSHVNKYY